MIYIVAGGLFINEINQFNITIGKIEECVELQTVWHHF